MIILKANTAYDIHFSTRDTDGNAADATGTPTAILFAGNTSLSGTVTVTVSSVSTGMYNASFTTPADISSYLGKTASLDISAMISTVAAKANKVIGMFDTKITSDLLDFDSTNDPVYKCYLATDAELTDDMVSQIDYSIELVVGTTLGYTPDRAAYLDNIDGHTPQTGDSYAVVTNTTYGLDKLVRATIPANTLDIDANGEVTVGAFNSNLSFTTNQNNAIASYSGLALHSYGAAKTSDLAGLATAVAVATVDDIVDAILVDTGTTLPAQLTSIQSHGDSNWATADVSNLATASDVETVDTVVDAIKAVTDKVDTMLVIDGAVYQLTANSLENAPSGSGATPAEIDAYLTTQHGSGSWQSGGTGSGSVSETITITDGTNPLDGVIVWVTTDSAGSNVVANGYTNASGQVDFMLDSGSYYLWKQLAGYNFENPEDLEIA